MSSARKHTTLLLAAAAALPLMVGGTQAVADPPDWVSGHHSYRDHDTRHRDNGYHRIADARDDHRRRDDSRRSDDNRRDSGVHRFTNRERDTRHEHFGRVFRALPHGYRRMRIKDRDYFMHEGRYYIREPRGYVLVRPPIGTFVFGLPSGFFSISIGGIPYFVAAGVYYQAQGNGYVVAAPPTPTPATIGPASGNVVVNVPLLNVRSGPGYEFGVIGVVNQGSNLPTYGQAPGWHYIQIPSGSYGWVNDNFIVIAPPPPEG